MELFRIWLPLPARNWNRLFASALSELGKLSLLVMLVMAFPSCRKREPPPKPKPLPASDINNPLHWIPKDFDKLPPERQATVLAMAQRLAETAWQRPYEQAQKAKDRADLVRSAPPGFKPSKSGKRVGVMLIPKKTTLRVGEAFWYRVELQNIGPDPISIMDLNWSFFKSGNAWGEWGLILTRPDGTEEGMQGIRGMHCPSHEITDLRGVPEERGREIMRRMEFMTKLAAGLDVTLNPGELLVTRPWKYYGYPEVCRMEARGQDPDAPIPGEFREFPESERYFDKPGTYEVKVVWVPGSIGVPDRRFAHLGLVFTMEKMASMDSNVVRLEVVP
ncbi:MAG: hypothetical protein HY748_11715 [Elusimicrobia bacterium]|nr:hypothetical protein [Elusimicrobiota bacterium]